MAETEIRAATAADVGPLLKAYEWLFAPPGAKPEGWDPDRAARTLREALASKGSIVLVARERANGGGAEPIVGFISAYLDLESVRYGLRCWVEDLAVEPEHRSRGIGAELLDAASAWAAERGATHLELDTARARTDAQRFYERRGDAAVGLTYSWRL